MYTQREKELVRELAKTYMGMIDRDRNAALDLQYRRSNARMGVRPVVLADEIPWDELNQNGELTVRCEDQELAAAEFWLRTQIYRLRHIPDDTIFPEWYEIKYHISSTGIGVEIEEDTLNTQSGSGVKAHMYHDQFPDEESVAKLKEPVITLDMEGTLAQKAYLEEVFGDILPVKITGHRVYCPVWDNFVRFHGGETCLWDLALRPEYLHAVIGRLNEVYMRQYDQYEALNVLEKDPILIHCTPGLTFDMPAADFDGVHIRKADVWGRGMAQILTQVSPAMYEEFAVDYAAEMFKDYGSLYWGCCEPLHNKIDNLRKLKNLKKISVSPWSDPVKAAEAIGRDYVYSFKTNPALMAVDRFNEEQAQHDLKMAMTAVRENGCQAEIIIKDISTINNRPENLFTMVKLAKQAAEEM